MQTNLYEVLQVNPSADIEVIRSAYKALANKYHPDKTGGNHEELMKQINGAYEILSDPKKRNQYDQELLTQEDDSAVYLSNHLLAVSNVLAAVLSKDTAFSSFSTDEVVHSRKNGGIDIRFDWGKDGKEKFKMMVYDADGNGLSFNGFADYISNALLEL